MTRKLAAIVAAGVVAALVVGSLAAIAVGHSAQPKPTVASGVTPTVTPAQAPASTSTPGNNAGSPLVDPTAAAAAGNAKVLFLTFDDGPHPLWTPKILQVLAKYGARATFFELGTMVDAHPGLREQVLAAGNTIGSHSVTHSKLTRISPAQRHHEIFDGPRSGCFRPPYGASNPTVRADISAAGMTQVLWDVDPRDWARPGTQAIVNDILQHAQRGNVILLHDGGGARSQTVAALDKVLPILQADGYTFPVMDC